jgi:7-cyano-7-deazaguanine synthase in queuosine biosynthesis
MINLETYPDDIALLFSGGIDSTLLFYLVSTAIKDRYPHKRLTLYIIHRYNNPINKAKRVYNLIIKKTKFPVELNVLTIPSVSQHHEITLASKIITNIHSTVICGFNKYPGDNDIRPKYIFNINESDKCRFPLAHLEKDKILQEFFNLGIDDILSFTHSCGSNNLSPCGVCFNCQERKWAYTLLGKSVNLGI